MNGGLFITSLASAELVVFLFFLVLYIVSLVRKDNRVSDIGWPIAFILAVAVVISQRDFLVLRQTIISFLVLVWGVRLALHFWTRRRSKGEDWWHKSLRRSWGEQWVLRSFLRLYLLQSVYVVLVALPVLYVSTFSGLSLGLLDFIGITVWVFGFVWEVIGDYQLMRFKKQNKNKGRVLKNGIWKYSRHPNYFGEVVMWFGIWIIALSVPGSFFTLIGPLLILMLLVWVRGIPILEKRLSANPEYLEYQGHTSIFVPWFSSK